MSDKFNNVKKHIKDHKVLYITGGACLVIGITTGVILGRGGVQISIANPAVMNWKPVANTVQVNMTRPGPKSFVVQCLETQKTWPSIRAAADDLGINPGAIGNHLKGKFPDVAGLHFEKIAEI